MLFAFRVDAANSFAFTISAVVTRFDIDYSRQHWSGCNFYYHRTSSEYQRVRNCDRAHTWCCLNSFISCVYLAYWRVNRTLVSTRTRQANNKTRRGGTSSERKLEYLKDF